MDRARSRQRGAVLVWATVGIVMMAALAALALNVGHLATVRGELRNGADSAALGAALRLRGTADTLNGADEEADALAAAHPTDRYDVATSDVRFGQWVRPGRDCDPADTPMPLDDREGNPHGYQFCEVTGTGPAAAFRANAVFVRTDRRAGSPGGPVPMVFGGILGRESAPVTGSAIAVTGGPCGGCEADVPMTVRLNCLTDASGGLACDPDAGEDAPGPLYTLGVEPTPVHGAGWTLLSSTSPSASAICDFFNGGGVACPEVGSEVTTVAIGGGTLFSAGCGGGTHVCDYFQPMVGESVTVPVVSDGHACADPYVGNAWIDGYATLRVLAVNCSPSPSTPNCVEVPGTGYCTSLTAPCSIYAAGKCVLAQLVCNHRSGRGTPTGCAWTGTSPLQPRLVR